MVLIVAKRRNETLSFSSAPLISLKLKPSSRDDILDIDVVAGQLPKRDHRPSDAMLFSESRQVVELESA